MKTRQLCMDAVLAAMCAVLGAVSLDFGNLKISFESLPVLVGALLFGPIDGFTIGGVGTLIYQLLRYGATVTTALWMLPYMLCGLLVGWYAKSAGCLEQKQMHFGVGFGCVLIFVLNTLVMYVDSKVYGYYSFVYIFGSLPTRIIVCLAKIVLFSAVMPMLISAAEKVMKR